MTTEHPEICEGCLSWQDVVNRRIVEHEWPGEPRNAHERRAWKKTGKPKCKGGGRLIWSAVSPTESS